MKSWGATTSTTCYVCTTTSVCELVFLWHVSLSRKVGVGKVRYSVFTVESPPRGRTDHFSNIFLSVIWNFDLWPWTSNMTVSGRTSMPNGQKSFLSKIIFWYIDRRTQ